MIETTGMLRISLSKKKSPEITNKLSGNLLKQKIKTYEEFVGVCKKGTHFESDDNIFEIVSVNEKGLIKTSRESKKTAGPKITQTFTLKNLREYFIAGKIRFK